MKVSGGKTLHKGSDVEKMPVRAFAVALLVASLLSCSARTSPLAADLREKILDAYGGRVRLAQIQSVAAEGTIVALVRGDRGTYRRAWKRDGKLFVDVKLSRSRETRVLNGDRALRSVDGKMEDVSGPKAAAMFYQYNELSMPFALLDDSYAIDDRGQEFMGTTPVHILRCTDRRGNSVDLVVNEVSYRIVQTMGRIKLDNGSTAAFMNELSDFKFVDGVLFPFKIDNFVNQTRIGETVIEDYLLNGPLNDAMFETYTHSEKH